MDGSVDGGSRASLGEGERGIFICFLFENSPVSKGAAQFYFLECKIAIGRGEFTLSLRFECRFFQRREDEESKSHFDVGGRRDTNTSSDDEQGEGKKVGDLVCFYYNRLL